MTRGELTRLVVGTYVGRELLDALRKARRRVWIACPYISCSVAALLPLVEDGRILTSPESELRLCVSVVKERGYEVKFLELLHAKLFIVDSLAFVGSVNLTSVGLRKNIELLIILEEGEELFRDILKVFEALWAMASRREVAKSITSLFTGRGFIGVGDSMAQELVALGKYRVPKDRLYTKTHEWVKIEGKTAIVGITDYAQSKLKNIVGVELPEVGKEVAKGGRLAVVESIKSVEDVYAPITIRVTEVNTALETQPELINKDPYGEGWIAKGEVVNEDEVRELLTPEKYVELLESEGE